MKSTHKVEVVQVFPKKHPNADSLDIIDVFGYQCVSKTGTYSEGSLAAWIPPDNLVDIRRGEFSFLIADAKYDANSEKGNFFARIKAKKIRGVNSYGLLVPAPSCSVVGDDVTERLGVCHYDPPERPAKGGGGVAGEDGQSPPGEAPSYDVDSFQRYARIVFTEGEEVIATEKIHGKNCRVTFRDGKLYVGSRTRWKKEYPNKPVIDFDKLIAEGVDQDKVEQIRQKMDNWSPTKCDVWQACSDGLKKWCEEHPDFTVYGECYGQVQDLRYGTKQGEYRFIAFDILKPDGNWMSFDEAANSARGYFEWVPIIYRGPYCFEKLVEVAEGKTLVGGDKNQIREGIVVQPVEERWHHKCGRVKLKIVSVAYLSR